MKHVAILACLTLLSACMEPGPPSALSPADGAVAAAAGTALPYGQTATVCGLAESDLGTPVETGGRYTLWDSAPGTTQLRPHFVTGLAGGCALQFSAALAILGDPATHETTRYTAENAGGHSATDRVYEAIKAAVCGAAEGQPCGARIDALTERATFVTAYEAFDSNPRWFEILIHDGALVASGGEGG